MSATALYFWVNAFGGKRILGMEAVIFEIQENLQSW